MRQLFYRWRLRVWKRRLAFRLIDLKAQGEHPISGKWENTSGGVTAQTKQLESKVAEAKHRIMIYLCRCGHLSADDFSMRVVTEGEKERDG